MGVAIGQVAVQVRIGDIRALQSRMARANGDRRRGRRVQSRSMMVRGNGDRRGRHVQSRPWIVRANGHRRRGRPVQPRSRMVRANGNRRRGGSSPMEVEEVRADVQADSQSANLSNGTQGIGLGTSSSVNQFASQQELVRSHVDQDNIPEDDDNEIFNEFANGHSCMASAEPAGSTPGSPLLGNHSNSNRESQLETILLPILNLTGVNGESFLLPIVVDHIDPADPYNVFHGQQLVNESSEPMELGSPIPDIFSYNGEDASIINFTSYHGEEEDSSD